jgi:hypothetical protein
VAKPRALVGCECSGRVRHALALRGWEVWSADYLPSEIKPVRTYYPDSDKWHHFGNSGQGFHYQGDVRDLFSWDHPVNAKRASERTWNLIMREPRTALWDLFIGHPPCDHLSLAGARWWAQKRADGRQDEAADFFMEMMGAPATYVAVENPIGDMKRRYRAPDQTIEPWWFGDPYAKKTCLWLKGLPLLVPDNEVVPAGRVTTGGGSWRQDKAAGRAAMSAYEDSEGRANRAKVRSRTFPGVARAMADQWGKFAEGQLS